MRDIHTIEGPKQYVEHIEDALRLVRLKHADAMMQGSLGSYSFWQGQTIVGEAWSHRTRPGWWLRIKK